MVPPSVVSSTLKTARFFAGGQAATAGAISVKVAALTEGVLKTMMLTKLKIATAVLLMVSVVGAGGLLSRHTLAVGPAQAQRKPEPREPIARQTAAVNEDVQKVLDKYRA